VAVRRESPANGETRAAALVGAVTGLKFRAAVDGALYQGHSARAQ
jgi:hypothetical protein